MNRRNEPTRTVDQPRVGLFKIKLVKGGPYVAARVYHGVRPSLLGRKEKVWWAMVNGHDFPGNPDPFAAEYVMRICNYGTEITHEEYHHMLANPTHHDPNEPIDIRREPTVF
jgi:hypothetical protein